ncbi:MAG: C-GCAxxG-C-C family protein [Thermoguttaceae bacterium]
MGKQKASDLAAGLSIITPAVAELVAIGAAVGANGEPCFKKSMKEFSRRQLLHSVGLTASTSFLVGCGQTLDGSASQRAAASAEPSQKDLPAPNSNSRNQWRYVQLDAVAVAAEAYRRVSDGGCMYGLFASIITALAAKQGEPYRSFPLHMMKYGAGGVGNWGSLCGAANGGAAIIGLFEQDKQRRENLIAQLFSWYEATELPSDQPKAVKDSEAFPKTVAGSVLCHVSVGNWCKASGDEIGSPEMKERCRRLTADVAAKTVELLNANLHEPCKFAGLSSEVQSCLSCHQGELHDTLGKMRCNSCHQQLSTNHPQVPNAHAASSGNSGDSKP